jgi:hypothetical protein
MTQSEQYIIPFDAMQHELLAQIAMLRSVDLGISPGRSEGVIQLLERLTLLGNDLRENNGIVNVRAQVIAIAARIQRRNSVSDRTVRYWRKDAEELGLVHTELVSQKFGRREWNRYTIFVSEIRLVCAGAKVAGSGRKWPEMVAALGAEMVAAPRAEMVAAPRAEMVAAPSNSSLKVKTNDNRERLVVVVASCGLGKAEEAVDTALGRLALSNCDIEARIAAWKQLPGDEQRPGTLFNWLAKHGSFEADQTARLKSNAAKPRPRVPDELRRQQAAEFDRQRAATQEAARSGPGMLDDYLAGLRQRETQTVANT